MRIVVVGTSGSGKTTLGRRLAERFDVPFIELDAINWQPGWLALHDDDPDLFIRRVTQAVSTERWVCDGNYGRVQRTVWARASHLVWLDYDRPVIMARVVRRSILRALNGRELWAGNREDWRQWLHASHPIRWAWDTWRRRREQYEQMIGDDDFSHLTVLRLRRPQEAMNLYERLTSATR